MKVTVEKILIGVLIILLGWSVFSNVNREEVKPKVITIEVPAKSGIVKDTLQIVPRDTVYLPSEVNPEIKEVVVVDSTLKLKYKKETDSLKRELLYLKAIEINDYEKILIDNDTIQITGKATTRGELLDFRIDYNIKPSEFSYIPEVISKRPSLSAGINVEAGVPTITEAPFILKGGVHFENGKGNGFSLGYDTRNRVWVGFSKTFKIIK
jgi:hypothetical protein